jgi:NACalpha-BTF3-like transcription factor
MSMAERMIFPKTIQEFIEEYAVTDENGNKVIPVFRMEQAHIYYGEQIRSKSIDEFVSRLEKHDQENWVDHQEYGITWSDIELIVEQMKGE